MCLIDAEEEPRLGQPHYILTLFTLQDKTMGSFRHNRGFLLKLYRLM